MSDNNNRRDAQPDMEQTVSLQRKAFLEEGPVTAETRIDRLDRAIDLLARYEKEICEALASDFGHRSAAQSRFTDVSGSIEELKHGRKNVKRWMKPERRSPMFPLALLGASARVEFQPLGVVGVISPWNFPVNLTFTPLAGIFSAGNRCMIKPSEFTPATSELMARMFAENFDVAEVALFAGDAEVGARFSALPFDHLLFTGATSVAKHVMKAAAENLVPVTLELGGKSPVVVGRTANIQRTTDNIMMGKMLNAGQICLAPDYVFVPASELDEFVAAATRSVGKMYPTLLTNPDYTSVINQRHFDRLHGYIADARSKGARIVEINPANEDFRQQEHHRIPPTLIIDPTEEMTVMQEEIFGPVLPVKPYGNVSEAIRYINDHPRPLGLYYFGNDRAEEGTVLSHTTSGGVTVNDVVMHVSMEDLPFGGVGPSGMGAYHGRDGFRTFSHARAILRQSKLDVAKIAGIRPPYRK